MDAWGWIATLGGVAIILATLVEVFLAVLHIDDDGFLAPPLHRGI